MMHKFLVALFLLYVPASMSALAHSGTDQEEKACTRDVQRFCRKLMDQGAANFPPKNEISDNRRSMQPQARCRNRLCIWRPTAWSPTLLFDRRAYGSTNLSRMPQKDFCNTISR